MKAGERTSLVTPRHESRYGGPFAIYTGRPDGDRDSGDARVPGGRQARELRQGGGGAGAQPVRREPRRDAVGAANDAQAVADRGGNLLPPAHQPDPRRPRGGGGRGAEGGAASERDAE